MDGSETFSVGKGPRQGDCWIVPIPSMGLAYLPTWMVDCDGKFVGKDTHDHGCYGAVLCLKLLSTSSNVFVNALLFWSRFPPNSLPVCVSVCLSVRLSGCLFLSSLLPLLIYSFVCLFICLRVYQFYPTRLFYYSIYCNLSNLPNPSNLSNPSIDLSTNLSIPYLSIYKSISLSLPLPLPITINLQMH